MSTNAPRTDTEWPRTVRLNSRSDGVLLLVALLMTAFCLIASACCSAELNATSVEVSELASSPGACHRTDIEWWGYGQNPEWSADGTKVLYDRRDASGTYQVYLRDLAIEGTDRCVTCEPAFRRPPLDRHKGYAAFHPSGRYIVMQVELTDYCPWEPALCEVMHRVAEPGRGWYNGIQLYDLERRVWTTLKSFKNAHLVPKGILVPRFSNDGRRLSWAELYDGKDSSAPTGNPMGKWRMAVAQFKLLPRPRLSSQVNSQPAGGNFYENHGFSPDDQWLTFSTDGQHPSAYMMDIWKWNMTSGATVNLTDSTDWEEHATWSNDGSTITFISSAPFEDYDPFDISTLRTEIFMMTSAGQLPGQLTWFNTAGSPEYNPEQSTGAGSAFSADGTELIVNQILVGPSYDTGVDRILWKISFAGSCGGTR